MKKWPMIAAIAVLMTACTANVTPPPPAGSPAASADWATAKVCTLEATPSNVKAFPLMFVKGKPSILRIWNNSRGGYSFASPEFFGAIAPWKLVHTSRIQEVPFICGGIDGVTIQRVPGTVSEMSLLSGPEIKSIDVGPGEVSDLYFVPLEEGHYSFECAMHAEATCAKATMIFVIAE